MAEWEITDQEIELTEKLLLPENAHFPEDARTVIHCWHSTDVSACPGSGKTTVLLAKLKILADRMPLENGAGICVLSHTNVAVDEIRKRLSGYTDKLMSYPNYFGTIQSFIDKFVTMPYLRDIAGRNVQVIDDQTYARYMLTRMYRDNKFKALRYVIDNNYKSSTQFSNKIQHIKEVYLRDDGSLCIGNQKKALAGAGKVSAQQFSILINDLLRFDGVITFRDAYSYANKAIDDLSSSYKDLFPMRFQYVFIDEYQDCDSIQRQALNLIFNSEKCSVMRIGDSDQAEYSGPFYTAVPVTGNRHSGVMETGVPDVEYRHSGGGYRRFFKPLYCIYALNRVNTYEGGHLYDQISRDHPACRIESQSNQHCA